MKQELKLNYRSTIYIAFAFFSILMLWQVYNTYGSYFLFELLGNTIVEETERAYIVGIIMALDNFFALFMLPIFGALSDKTKTRFGRRIPYIFFGMLVSAIIFPLIAVMFLMNSLVGVILMMLLVLVVMNIYRNPAIALMPDVTPKPLRSKANGVINLVGYVGAIIAGGLALYFGLGSVYVNEHFEGTSDLSWQVTEARKDLDGFDIDGGGMMLRSPGYAYTVLPEGVNTISLDVLKGLEPGLAEERGVGIYLLGGDLMDETAREAFVHHIKGDEESLFDEAQLIAYYKHTLSSGDIEPVVFDDIDVDSSVQLMIVAFHYSARPIVINNLIITTDDTVYEETFATFDGHANPYIALFPFLIVTGVMLVALVVLVIKIKENKLVAATAEDMLRGETMSDTIGIIKENVPLNKTDKRNLWLIIIAVFLWFAAFNAIETFISIYAEEVLGAFRHAGTVVIILGVSALVTFMPAGFLAMKIGRKLSVLIGLGILIVGLVLCWSLNTFNLLFMLGIALSGVGWAMINVNSYPMVVEMAHKNNVGKLTGYYYTGSMLAQTFTPIVVGFVIMLGDSYEMLFPYSTALIILALIVFFFVKERKGVKRDVKTGLDAFDVE